MGKFGYVGVSWGQLGMFSYDRVRWGMLRYISVCLSMLEFIRVCRSMPGYFVVGCGITNACIALREPCLIGSHYF